MYWPRDYSRIKSRPDRKRKERKLRLKRIPCRHTSNNSQGPARYLGADGGVSLKVGSGENAGPTRACTRRLLKAARERCSCLLMDYACCRSSANKCIVAMKPHSPMKCMQVEGLSTSRSMVAVLRSTTPPSLCSWAS